jgi:hypothetical protein
MLSTSFKEHSWNLSGSFKEVRGHLRITNTWIQFRDLSNAIQKLYALIYISEFSFSKFRTNVLTSKVSCTTYVHVTYKPPAASLLKYS